MDICNKVDEEENIMISGVRQAQKDKGSVVSVTVEFWEGEGHNNIDTIVLSL